ncbi:hypothetical protein L5G28_04650 [Gordonia sp. HY285]|uniref:glycine-rich domain-containing protein n=1 Tax=Gordonia liuliyuniae TaxID=2911517 RepID=UPI001F1A274D|nr:hypothetical protein [Gordonia liuliyuniae]MCF8609450.1 hypothetical protein [Gordonia liuliyuniae]
MAAALGNDPNFAATIAAQIGAKAATRRFERGVRLQRDADAVVLGWRGWRAGTELGQGWAEAGQAITVTGIGSGLSAAGGAGTTSGQNGASPGNSTFEHVVYTGGAGGAGNAGSPTAPGAAEVGGKDGIFGSRTRGAAGARGQAWCRFRSWS